MINIPKPTYSLYLLFFLLFSITLQAQSSKRQQLENQRKEYVKQIRQLERLMSKGKKEQRTILSNLDNLNYKISVRQNLINITNQQANLLTREMNNNQKQITHLRNRLQVLKEEYAAMIVKSYKSRSEENKVMFLLSSTNFQQAYKRLQYIKQYANYQKKQGEEIKVQTVKLQDLNKGLVVQKQDKQKLIEENRAAKKELDKEVSEFESLKVSINKDLNKYRSEIKTNQQEVDRIDREIDRIIKEAIAASNRKAGKTGSSTFALTPEERNLASNFAANKGKLPWPVREGVKKIPFGTTRSPIDRNVKINSIGIGIATNKNEKVRAVFEGVVLAIMLPKNGNNIVMIRHGSYITIYKNLEKIYVKKGDKISTRQEIGEVRTNNSSGEAILTFVISKDGKYLNPAYWVKQ